MSTETGFIATNSARFYAKSTLTIHENPSQEMRDQLANAIDLNAHMDHPIDRNKLMQAPYVMVVKNHQNKVVAGSSIKMQQGALAEIGFMFVSPVYRRQGLAQAMTEQRIRVARDLGVSLLYAMVKTENMQSRNNLLKHGFVKAASYLTMQKDYTDIDCFTKFIRFIRRKAYGRLVRQALALHIAEHPGWEGETRIY